VKGLASLETCPMSISFEIVKEPKGWRFRTDTHVDLTNWNIDCRRNAITCTPEPLEFVYMALGAVVFLGLAGCALKFWIGTWGFPGPWAARQEWRSRDVPVTLILCTNQDPARSIYQQDPPSLEEARQTTEQMLENLLKDKTPEERAAFLKKINDEAARKREQSRQQNEERRARQASFGMVAAIVWAIIMLVVITVFSLVGGACLLRAIRYFRDRLELFVEKGALIVRRPKTFGGLSYRALPLRELSSIACNGTLRRNGGQFVSRRVYWIVHVACVFPAPLFMKFEFVFPLETSHTVPPDKVREFALALQKMTGGGDCRVLFDDESLQCANAWARE
jgi:hypothetical protein